MSEDGPDMVQVERSVLVDLLYRRALDAASTFDDILLGRLLEMRRAFRDGGRDTLTAAEFGTKEPS